MRGWSLTDDVIDLRDITARVEEIEGDTEFLKQARNAAGREPEDQEELDKLLTLLFKLEGGGGDHDWRGSWYPQSLIREDYMGEYARDYFDETTTDEDRNKGWPFNHIDWGRATEEFKQDYQSIEIDDITFMYR